MQDVPTPSPISDSQKRAPGCCSLRNSFGPLPSPFAAIPAPLCAQHTAQTFLIIVGEMRLSPAQISFDLRIN